MSLVGQWLRIPLPLQGTCVQSLNWEDSAEWGDWAHVTAIEPVLWSLQAHKRSHCNDKPKHQMRERPHTETETQHSIKKKKKE